MFFTSSDYKKSDFDLNSINRPALILDVRGKNLILRKCPPRVIMVVIPAQNAQYSSQALVRSLFEPARKATNRRLQALAMRKKSPMSRSWEHDFFLFGRAWPTSKANRIGSCRLDKMWTGQEKDQIQQ